MAPVFKKLNIQKHCPTQLSTITEKFYICTVQYVGMQLLSICHMADMTKNLNYFIYMNLNITYGASPYGTGQHWAIARQGKNKHNFSLPWYTLN